MTALSSSFGNNSNNSKKPRILCLHGKHQSGATFANKIAGARRKFAQYYDLDFLDGPVWLNQDECEPGQDSNSNNNVEPSYGWWIKTEAGEHQLVRPGLEYVVRHVRAQTVPYRAVIGFSQGGVVATALASSGLLSPNVKAVVTAGAPMVTKAFDVADEIVRACLDADDADDDDDDATSTIASSARDDGLAIPKLHLAGEQDSMISVASTAALCERGGNGRLLVHDQGHLLPTRSVRVQEMLDFLQEHVCLPLAQEERKTRKKLKSE